VEFTFNGKRFAGHPGDTLASALMANGQRIVGRSFKYHRPRGIVASGGEEPNALVNLGQGRHARAEPARHDDGAVRRADATSQNHWPSLEWDIGEVNALSALPARGVLLQDLHVSAPFWKHVFEPFIRQSAGLGKAPDPKHTDPDRYEHFYAHVDIVVAGGGIAGLQAALEAGRAGAKVLSANRRPIGADARRSMA
jgi:sarcosine oxidase subunit alpha